MALANTIFAFYSPMLILIRRERVVKRSAVRRGPGDNANFLLADIREPDLSWCILETMRMCQTIRTSFLERHVHAEAYCALVLSGGYEEAGDQGRYHLQAGQVVFHHRFEAHLDRFFKRGAVILNLHLPEGCSYKPGIAKVAAPDSVVHSAERSRDDAVELLISTATTVKLTCVDWPDELAEALIHNPSLKLSQWAEEKRLAPWTVSRGFAQVFGVTAEAFRARARARRAWKAIQDSPEPLAEIAAHLGFADQSHMTRSVKQLTGRGPQTWRTAANRFKTK
jgi:AraC-like DNA-binding protein